MSLPVSAVIITKNEAHRLLPVLGALHWADEIVVVDSGSTDGTIELCEKYGARVIQEPFAGFGQQKQKGVEMANNNWILSLDADEVLSEETTRHIQNLLRQKPPLKAYFIRRQLVFMGRRFRFGREARDYQLRFFNRDFAAWNTKPVHEKVEYAGEKGKLTGYVSHYSYVNLQDYLLKFNKYTDLAAAELKSRKKSRSSLMLILSFPWNFFKIYIINLNILNGFAGFIWSLMSSVYPVIKYSKAKENS